MELITTIVFSLIAGMFALCITAWNSPDFFRVIRKITAWILFSLSFLLLGLFLGAKAIDSGHLTMKAVSNVYGLGMTLIIVCLFFFRHALDFIANEARKKKKDIASKSNPK